MKRSFILLTVLIVMAVKLLSGQTHTFATQDGNNVFIGTNTFHGFPVTVTVSSGLVNLPTSFIGAQSCAPAVSVAMSAVLSSDNIAADFNADPTSTSGYNPVTTGMLTIVKYPSTGHVNFKVCNNTASGITPGAVALNWKVFR